MDRRYKAAKAKVMEAFEGIALVKAPPEAYLAALKEIQEESDNWLEASIDAAKQDVRRASEED